MIFLSYILDIKTPTYGNSSSFEKIQKSNISLGDIANNSFISSTVHIGTHIDMPYHFYKDGQTIEDFDASFWIFKKPLIIEIKQKELIINENLISKLGLIDDIGYDILIVKTGICELRDKKEFWEQNYGFHPNVASFLRDKFKTIKVLGFDSISISSWQHRVLGRESHKAFLNPENPILILEDMNLVNVKENTEFKEIIVAPLRIETCDGLPCTIFGRLND